MERFFEEIDQQLQAVEREERELNRRLAKRFHALEYLRTDELGLSRIIADLLKVSDDAVHGQGSRFLKEFLANLGRELSVSNSGLGLDKARVSPEHRIEYERRIDIYVEIPVDGGTFRLAIENKPYARDSKNQVQDYLKYLRSTNRPSDDFLLIYLSRTGEGPSEHSLPRSELKSWAGKFTIMPYYGPQIGSEKDESDHGLDPFKGNRTSFSLADWLASCRKACHSEAKNLQWFLKEAESFCQRKFGGQTMRTSSKTDTVREYLYANPDHFRTAQRIYESWADVKKSVCERFLEHLRYRIEDEARTRLSRIDNVHFRYKFRGDKAFGCNLFFYRSSWKEYEDSPDGDDPKTTTIWLQNERTDLQDFMYGVSSPLHENYIKNRKDKDRRKRLNEKLCQEMKGGWKKENKWWPIHTYASDEFRDWNKLLPNLHRECEDNDGPITKYYVDILVELATQAIPIIDEIESPCRPNQARNSTS